jgi:hypothetical protein
MYLKKGILSLAAVCILLGSQPMQSMETRTSDLAAGVKLIAALGLCVGTVFVAYKSITGAPWAQSMTTQVGNSMTAMSLRVSPTPASLLTSAENVNRNLEDSIDSYHAQNPGGVRYPERLLRYYSTRRRTFLDLMINIYSRTRATTVSLQDVAHANTINAWFSESIRRFMAGSPAEELEIWSVLNWGTVASALSLLAS